VREERQIQNMIIGLLGQAGSGKDTVADFLVRDHSFVKVALADPLKRICRDVFDFTDEQLWGPSEKRNAPDKRYPRPRGYSFPTSVPGAVWFPLSGGQHTLIDQEDLARVSAAGPWYSTAEKYASARIDGQPAYLHRFIIGMICAGNTVDHINLNGLDNRKTNLRQATRQQNNANAPPREGTSSPFKGVYFAADRSKWCAQISIDGKSKHVGIFASETDAAMAYDAAAREQYGEFARLNTDLFLTPRHALQQLGTEFGRNCHPDVWVSYALRVATLLGEGGHTYSAQRGLNSFSLVGDDTHTQNAFALSKKSVVIPDVRFRNEVDAIRAAGGVIWKITRPGAGLQGAAGGHVSETEQNSIPSALFGAFLDNNGTLTALESMVNMLLTKP